MAGLKKVDHYIYIPRKGEDVRTIICPDSEKCNGYYRIGKNYYIEHMDQVDSLRNQEHDSIETFLRDFKKYYEEIYNENDTYEFWIHFGQVGNEEHLDYFRLETRINDMRSDELKNRVFFQPVSINGRYPAKLRTEDGRLVFPGNTPLCIPSPPPESEEKPVRPQGRRNRPNKIVPAVLWLTESIFLSFIAVILLIWTLVPSLMFFSPNAIDFKTKTVTIPLPFFYENEDNSPNSNGLNGNTKHDSCVYVVEGEKTFIPYLCLTFCFFTYALNLILVFILIRKLFRHYSRKKRICRLHEFHGNLESVIRDVENKINLPGFPEIMKPEAIMHANQLRERFVQAAIRLYFDGDDGE